MTGQLFSILVCHPGSGERNDLVARLEALDSTIGIASAESFDTVVETVPDIVFFRPAAMLGDTDDVMPSGLGSSGRSRFIALITINEANRIPRLFQAGVAAFVLPDAPAGELETAMRTVRQGGTYLAHELANALFSPGQNRQQFIASVGLTAREQEVLRLIAVNMSNKEIARRLDLSVRTVETHRLNIRKKANAGNWRELAVIAGKLGLFGDYDLFAGLSERVATPGFHED